MIDIRLLRDNPDAVRASQRARGADEGVVDRILELDATRRSSLGEFERVRAEQKQVSKSVGAAMGALNKAKKSGDDAEVARLQAEAEAARENAATLSARVKELEATADEAGKEFDALLRTVPNVVLDGVPAGGEDDFVTVKTVGEAPTFDFEPKDHLEIGELIGAIDMERGTKVSGSRFYFLKGVGARLELALLQMALDQAIANDFTPMITPTLVRPETMQGTGFDVAHDSEIYRVQEEDNLYLVGTSEVALAGYHADEILNVDAPVRYAGWSSCYRREAGSYGKDTRGIIRVHQFNKVEMFSYCRIEDAEAEHARMLAWEEEMLAKCELSYRVIDTAAGDLGTSAARKFDCEAWVPTQRTYRELTSTSNCTTFQARRLNIRERTDGSTRSVATLNGTLATTRWLVAILETHQQADGSVRVPEALRTYMGGLEVLPVV